MTTPDLRALRTEQRDLTSGAGDNWNWLDDYPPHPERIAPLEPFDAYWSFMVRFDELTTARYAERIENRP